MDGRAGVHTCRLSVFIICLICVIRGPIVFRAVEAVCPQIDADGSRWITSGRGNVESKKQIVHGITSHILDRGFRPPGIRPMRILNKEQAETAEQGTADFSVSSASSLFRNCLCVVVRIVVESA